MSYRKYMIRCLVYVVVLSIVASQTTFPTVAQEPIFIKLIEIGRSYPTSISWYPSLRQSTLSISNAQGVMSLKNGFQDEVVIDNHPQDVDKIEWSPDGSYLASVTEGREQVTLWDNQNSRVKATIPSGDSRVTTISWSPTSERIAVGRLDGDLMIFDIPSEESTILSNDGNHAVNVISWKPDGSRLASGYEDGIVKIWNLSNEGLETVFEQHTAVIQGIAWNPHDDRIASVDNRQLLIWNANDGQLSNSHDGRKFVKWMSDGNSLYTQGLVDDKWTIVLWDTVQDISSTLVVTLESDRLIEVAISPDENYAATLSYGGSTTESVRVWDLNTGNLVHTVAGYTLPVDTVAWSPDDGQLSSTHGNIVYLWDAKTGDLAHSIEFEGGFGLTWNHDWTYVAGSSAANTVGIWDMELEPLPNRLALNSADRVAGHDYPGGLENLTWSPQGDFFATSSEDGTIRIWEISQGGLGQAHVFWLGETENEVEYATSLTISPNGSLIAVGLSNGEIKIWELSTENQVATIPATSSPVTAVTWHPNGNIFISTYIQDDLYLWDVTNNYTLLTTWENERDVGRFAWSPNGEWLAGSGGSYIQIWDSASGELADEFLAHSGGITSIAWNHIGNKLASGSTDGTVKIWTMVTNP